MKLFVVTHLPLGSVPADRTPIGVGERKLDGVSLYDSAGENIAGKNRFYCELTALYWIWKNDRSETVGLEHYRRFFSRGRLVARPQSAAALERLLDGCDVLLPKELRFPCSVEEQYGRAHEIRDLDLCRECIEKHYPAYLYAFECAMQRRNMSPYNMFVMRRETLERYCEWLFDVLLDVEPQVRFATKNAYQSRVFGFLAERLFGVWLLHHQPRIRRLSVYDNGQNLIIGKFMPHKRLNGGKTNV